MLDGHIHLQSNNYDMMDSEIELFLRENIIGASLESFGIKHQFLELSFSIQNMKIYYLILIVR